jgi:hypothetical protein
MKPNYKLILKYPTSLLEVGDIIEWDTKSDIPQYRCLVKGKGVSNIEPSQYPDHWEEVIKKDYKILTFKGCVSNTLYELDDAGLYRNKTLIKAVDFRHAINNKYPIHSVRRETDGEVFTVGDKINRQDGRYKKDVIRGFSIDSTDILLVSISNSIDASYCGGKGCNLHVIDHYEKPLLISDDGVEIYEGDECWGISKNNLLAHNYIMTKDYKVSWVTHYFSTKEAGDRHIFMNKPSLSINDVMNAGYGIVTSAPLERIVKQKEENDRLKKI